MSAADTSALSGRICVVTGATRGIGRSAALEAAKRGAHVIALGRTTGALEELDDEIAALGGSVTLVQFDLTDGEAVDRLGATIYERWGRLDALIGNAGLLGHITPVPHIVPKEWDKVLAVNVTANWRLVRSLDPVLRLSDAGRVVFVTSGAADTCKPFWGLYALSKSALNTLARTYAAETASTPIRVNLFSPGATRTRMRADAVPGEDPMSIPHPDEVAPALVDLIEPNCSQSGQLFDFRKGRFLDFALPD